MPILRMQCAAIAGGAWAIEAPRVLTEGYYVDANIHSADSSEVLVNAAEFGEYHLQCFGAVSCKLTRIVANKFCRMQ